MPTLYEIVDQKLADWPEDETRAISKEQYRTMLLRFGLSATADQLRIVCESIEQVHLHGIAMTGADCLKLLRQLSDNIKKELTELPRE